MSRNFVSVDENFLKDKILTELKKGDYYKDFSNIKSWEELTTSSTYGDRTYHSFDYTALRNIKRLNKTIETDLGKVDIDDENCMGPGEDKYHGFVTLDNGFTFFGMSAGGDWEYPVYLIIYWDGKKLRGYIPTDGNPWNTSTKMAYGNDEDDDRKNIKKRYNLDVDDASDLSDITDFDKIFSDIKERIVEKK